MGNANSSFEDPGFPGADMFDSFNLCGSLADAEASPKPNNGLYFDKQLFDESEYQGFGRNVDERDENPTSGRQSQPNRTSALFAKALVNEVTNNPHSMRPAAMAERERRLMKAQEEANKASANGEAAKVVGIPGGVGEPSVLGSIAHALTGRTDPLPNIGETKASILPPNSMTQNRAQIDASNPEAAPGKHTITIGISLSRRSAVGHRDTITRQTAFDFNELQDREYKYVSSTDGSGWRAGGGEPGGAPTASPACQDKSVSTASPRGGGDSCKIAAPDVVHIPIIQIDAGSAEAIDIIIAAFARGELFIPHMSVIPEALSVDGVSPPDLVVRFGTERNEDLPPDQWPNWCLEFMHNQLYEYFQNMGARWGKRPFSITLAEKVRWKTVKHMNKYFSHAERVIDAWREKGPQYLDPQLAYVEGGTTPEEVARPHGVYLFRNGVPTNYFAPNFDPPYTTNMTRNLLLNVLNKSWDKKRRKWTSEPIPRLVTPAMLMTAMCGCTDNMAGGYMANQVTVSNTVDLSTIPDGASISSGPHSAVQKRVETVEEEKPEEESPREEASTTPASVHTPQLNKVGGVEETKEEMEFREDSEHQQPTRELETISNGFVKGNERKPKMSPLGSGSNAPSPSYKDLSNELELFITSHHAYGTPTNEEQIAEAEAETDKIVAGIPSHLRQSSHTGTDTTAKHTNVSATQQLLKQALVDGAENLGDKKATNASISPKLASDEDWLDDMGEPIETPTSHEALSVLSFPSDSADSYSLVFEDPSGDMSDATPTERTNIEERELTSPVVETEQPPTPVARKQVQEVETRQDAPETQEEASERSSDPPSTNGREAPEIEQENRGNPVNALGKRVNDPAEMQKIHPEVLRNNSAVSLDYSIDSTLFGDKSAFTNQSSLLGQHFSSPELNRPFMQKQPKNLLNTVTHESTDEELFQNDSEDSSSEIVPSDEELFNVGWAKALDPTSRSHYYFTLDRSTIVWDNPLGSIHTRPSVDTMDSSSLLI